MKNSTPAFVIGFMTAICVVFGGGIALVHYATLPLMMRNDALLRDQKICTAFMLKPAGTSAAAVAEAVANHIDTFTVRAEAQSWKAWRSRTSNGDIGFQFSGIGFWDVITGIVVLSPDMSSIQTLTFLKQSETPGLGARIEEPWFTDQFKGLLIAWDRPVAQRIVIGASPDPQARNRVDAIIGATQTSSAVMQSLNTELDAFARALKNQ